ncbi:gigaxonin-like [Babylonia areolata]|uniref:gigaxonin-like n=1 Tax=Babylonia areolata TaxID=304850 RepID=UPI003FD4D026
MAAPESETGTRYTCQHHAKKLLSNLNDTRKNPDLCDAYVSVDGHKISVQKSVLAAASHYLRALFSYDGKLALHEGKTCINLNMSVDTFHSIADYIYTSDVVLTEDNIQDVLQAADLLLLTDLKDICCKFLEECIAPHNCIGIRDFTAQISCPWLHLRVTQYLDEHLREATFCEEFLRLSKEEVCQLLTRNTLEVTYEDDVVEAVVRWARMDVPARLPLLPEVLTRCVRPGLIQESLFARLPVEPDLVQEVEAVLRAKRDCGGEVELPRGTTPVIVICGGEGPVHKASEELEVIGQTRFVPVRKPPPQYYSQSAEEEAPCHWMNMAPMLTPRSGHGLVEVGGYLYAVGGRDQHCRLLNSGEKYDPMTNTWTPIAPMDHARVGFGLVAVDDNIYAMGGSNDMTDPLVTMEVYNVFTDKWRPLPDMILKRVWSAFAATNKKIYVMSGGIVGKFYEAVECFDTRTETWTSVSPMRERRCDARAVAVDNDIYVFGGFRRLECPSALHSGHSLKFCGVEMYASKNDYWMPLPSRYGAPGLCNMSRNCNLYGALYDGSDVLVVGTLEVSDGRFNCVRAFNRSTSSWQTVVPNMPDGQERYACCLLRIPRAAMQRLEQLPGNRPGGVGVSGGLQQQPGGTGEGVGVAMGMPPGVGGQ